MYDIKFKIAVGKPTDQNIEKTRQQQQQQQQEQQQQQQQCFGDCLDLAMFRLVWKTLFFLFLCVVSTKLNCISSRKGLCMDNKKNNIWQYMATNLSVFFVS